MSVVNIGAAANDGTGDAIRTGISKVNDAFAAVTMAVVPPGTVETAMLADLGVTTAKLANLAVTTAKIADNAVTGTKLASSAVADSLGYTPAALTAPGGRLLGTQFPSSVELAATASFVADSDLDYTIAGTSGYFTNFDCKTGLSFRLEQSENLSGTGESGAFRDAVTIQHIDLDNTAYSGITRTTVSYGLRVLTNGSFSSQEKDLVGASFTSIARIEWSARGVSGITADAIQYGSGIASNEFIAENPAAANSLSVSMAAVQAVVRQRKGASDVTHKARGLLVQNDQGYAITAAIDILSTTGGGSTDGSFNTGIDLSSATVNSADIKMARAGAGSGVIEYDTNDYTVFNRTTNVFIWAVAGSVPFSVNSAGAKLASYTVAGVPSAATAGAGTIIYVSNETGGAVPAFSDGANWRRVTDRIVVS